MRIMIVRLRLSQSTNLLENSGGQSPAYMCMTRCRWWETTGRELFLPGESSRPSRGWQSSAAWKLREIRWKSLTLPLQSFGAWRMEKKRRTSLKCKTSWSFNNPMRYVFTLAIIVFSFCVFYLTTFQGPANLFHLLREWTMCWAQKQLPLSGCGSLHKQFAESN